MVTDLASLEGLKTRARENPEAAAKDVARQFEGLLVHMMIKSMRQASLGEGILDSKQSLFYRDMYDQQLAEHLSAQGLGLADVILSQLGLSDRVRVQSERTLSDYRAAARPPLASRKVEEEKAAEQSFETPEEFVEALLPHAREAAEKLGLDPEALLAQAALETGWGKALQRRGSNSHNLFGIKADSRWDGEQAAVSTLEYIDGVAVRKTDRFRAYGSYAESFADYVRFLQQGARYRDALGRTDEPEHYFRALQDAGYATDPDYADKVLGVLGGDSMRAALAAVEV